MVAPTRCPPVYLRHALPFRQVLGEQALPCRAGPGNLDDSRRHGYSDDSTRTTDHQGAGGLPRRRRAGPPAGQSCRQRRPPLRRLAAAGRRRGAARCSRRSGSTSRRSSGDTSGRSPGSPRRRRGRSRPSAGSSTASSTAPSRRPRSWATRTSRPSTCCSAWPRRRAPPPAPCSAPRRSRPTTCVRRWRMCAASHRVTDQSPEEKYQALERYTRNLTEQARQGKARPGHRPGRGGPPGDAGAFPADQEQSGADRRARRRQDGDRRGAGPAHRERRRARVAAQPGAGGARHRPAARGRQVSGASSRSGSRRW